MKSKLSLLLLLLCLLFCACESAKAPPVGSTAADISTSSPETSAAPETVRWYLTEETFRAIETLVPPDGRTGEAIRTPVEYTATVDNIDFKVEFFEEYHNLGGYLQVRISATNRTGKIVTYDRKTASHRIIDSNSQGGFIYPSRVTPSVEMLNQIQSTYFITVQDNDIDIIEYAYLIDPAFFTVNGSYHFQFDYDVRLIEIPIELVNID